MATAARAKKAPPQPPESAQPVGRRRRWLFTTTVLIGLPTMLWFAPAVFGFGPLLNRLIARATTGFHGTISVGNASLGWLSPVVIRDLEVRDFDGKSLAAVPMVASGKTLLALLMSPHELGSFKLHGPQLHIALRDAGSNVEDALPPSSAPDEKPRRRLGLSLVIVEGVAKIDDQPGGRQWLVDEFNGEITLPNDDTQAVAVAASGRVTPGEPAGRFTVRLKIQPRQASADVGEGVPPVRLAGGQGEFALTSQALPLELIEPLLNRVAAGSEVAGVLESNVSGQWNFDVADTPRGELNGQIALTHFALLSPWLGEDRLRLESLQMPCNVVREGRRLEVHRCDIDTDVGQMTCSGTVDDVGELGPDWLRSLYNLLPRTEGELKGTIDLARLSRLLPTTLRVRDRLQIEEGSVNLDLTSGMVNGQWACSGRLETTRLLAVEDDRQIAWEHPLLVTVAGHDTPQGPVIEQLNGQSDFLKFEGSGTPEFFGLSANFELARLMDQLGQFLDLGTLHVGGDGFGRLTWKRAVDDSFQADAELQATNFILARPGKPAWSDPRLVVTAAMKGQFDGRVMKRVDTATIQVASATDEFSATLVAPVDGPSTTTDWTVDTHLRGELARWLARVEPWFSPPGWDISGQADVVSTVRYSPGTVAIENCQADFVQLHAWGPALFIDEPRIRLTGSGQVAMAANSLRVTDAVLTGADVSGRLQDVTLRLGGDAGLERVEHGEMQGNLATLRRWTQDPREPGTLQLSGLVAGSLHADLSDRSPALDLSITVEDLAAVGSSSQQPWREHQLRVTANAAYDEINDAVQLSHLDVESEAVRLNAAGRIEHWSKDRQLALAGKTEYDLEKLSQLLAPVAGGEIRATGRESRSFSLAGPIATAIRPGGEASAARDEAIQQLVGKTEFGWQSASLFGFDIAAGSLQASLDKGILQIVPAKLSVSGGSVTLAPAVRLAPAPAGLHVPACLLVDRVRVSPEMCRQWLMYVAPVVAGVAQVDGTFSMQLAGCQVPLASPADGEIAGQVIVHSLEVEPGPLVRELATVLGAASAVKLAQQSKIDFKMVQGRVYHRGLELQFPEATVRTYGSVGLDQTLAIMAEMNVPLTWIRDAALREDLKKQVIQIPIAGTLARPEIDRQKLAELRGQFVRDAAGGVLRNELQRQINRLLAPPEPKQ